MLTPNDILDRLEELVRENFPGETVYRDLTPEDFERPSNLIVLDSCKGQINFGTKVVELWPVVTLTTFVLVDEYYHSHLAALHLRQMTLTGLFLPGYIKVGDRAPHVDEVSLDGGFDYDTVTATLRYTLSRSDFESMPQLPKMEQLHLNEEVRTYG